MERIVYWFTLLFIINACTCGGKTECSDNAKISVVMNLHSEICNKMLSNGKPYDESENHLLEKYNYTYDGLNIETVFFDNCGSNSETMKSIFKTMNWANADCFQPPYFLGFVGPEDIQNLNVALKITSALKIPHITEVSHASTYVHSLPIKEYQQTIKGIFKLVELLKWKTFIFIDNPKDDASEYIAEQFKTKALAMNLCLLEYGGASPYVIFIGKLDEQFLKQLRNSFIIVIGSNNYEDIQNINSTNSVLIFDNIRSSQAISSNDIVKLKAWDKTGLQLHKNVHKANFIRNAIIIFAKSLQQLCKKKNCYADKDSEEWNDIISEISLLESSKNRVNQKILNFNIKKNDEEIQGVGHIIIHNNNDIKIMWNEQSFLSGDTNHYYGVPGVFKRFINNDSIQIECSRQSKKIDTSTNKNSINQYESSSVVFTEMTESEWWTMVCTVGGFGIAMFTIGFCAVYVVYTNIRGSENTKDVVRRDMSRDSSLRRVGSDRQESISNNRNQRMTRGLQRRDSRSSIRSNMSEKSV